MSVVAMGIFWRHAATMDMMYRGLISQDGHRNMPLKNLAFL